MPSKPSVKPLKFMSRDGIDYEFPVYEDYVPAAIYLRISQDRTGDGDGVTRQLEDCVKYADLHRLTVIEVIEENDTSAYVAPHREDGVKPRKPKRPGFERLKAIATSGEIHAVVAWATDRLWRSVRDLDQLINIVETTPHGFTIHAVHGGIIGLGDANGQTVARILGAVAQGEVNIKAKRQARAHEQAFDRGKFPGGRVPFGYRLGEKPGELVLHEDRAEVLRDIADGIINDGWTITRATRFIREELPKRCGKMKPVALRGILTGPTVAGKRYYLPVAQKRSDPEAKGTWGPAGWEPVFDEVTWQLLRKALATTPRGRPTRPSLLGGLLLCAYCGSAMSYSTRTYKCTVTSGCGRISVSTPTVEAVVTDFITTLLTAQETQEFLKRMLNIGDGPPGTDDINIDAELEKIARKRRELTEAYDDEVLTMAELRHSLDRLKAKEQALLTKREENVEAALEWERSAMAFQAYEDLLDATDDDAIKKKNMIFRALLDGIVVSPREKNSCKFDTERLNFRLAGTSPYIPLNDREDISDDGVDWWTEDPGDLASHPSPRELVQAGVVKEPVPRRKNRKAARLINGAVEGNKNGATAKTAS
ncbi:hypothetical protein FHJ30_13035 [Arthrobacter sp. BB-1]|uniref:recombinase family protein n=1 Tax=unclassified Arthrobacter TaxID=235627 RepID=UPI001112B3AD|nr:MULTISPECIES: recombinase family protein [unclassified Arthrobacter]TNB71606.1 hypothetical protein FHJ30_13035 [Arthrobacter sp. BB-1]